VKTHCGFSSYIYIPYSVRRCILAHVHCSRLKYYYQTNFVVDCNTPDNIAPLLARELLVTTLGPVFDVAYERTLFTTTIFGLADTEEPKQMISIDEFPSLYELIIRRYNLLPSVCPESVFDVCNSDDDQFLTDKEIIDCGRTQP